MADNNKINPNEALGPNQRKDIPPRRPDLTTQGGVPGSYYPNSSETATFDRAHRDSVQGTKTRVSTQGTRVKPGGVAS